MTLQSGTLLGPYEIVDAIGEGGMGEVYRARDPRIDRDVAIKVLPSSFADHPDRLRRFEQEARAAGSLNHPNLLTIFELGTWDGTPYIVSELLEGKTLRETLHEIALQSLPPNATISGVSAGAPLPLKKVTDYGSQVAVGLAAAHEKGIVHRDLKPENLFVTRDGRVKILDFGLAKLTTAPNDGVTEAKTAEHRTDPGTVLGTMGYMSPEQVRGMDVDGRSDIFSLGAILYEMATGTRAFRGETGADTMSAILTKDPFEGTASGANLSPGLRRIIEHCLEKAADHRFQSSRDLAFDLSSLSSISETGVTRAETEVASRRSRVPILVIAALLAGIVAGAAAVFFGRPVKTHEPPRFHMLTHSGRDADPVASPDGQTIAFSSVRNSSVTGGGRYQGAGRIWVKQLNGGGEVAITDGPLDSSPRFSPDGSTLLFLRTEGDSVNLYRIPLLGGDARKIREGVTSADWSPDGKEIVFTALAQSGQSRVSSIGAISTGGSGERTIAKVTDRVLSSVRWSRDGRRLAVVAGPTTGTSSSQIMIVEARTGSVEPFEDPLAKGLSLNPAWAPDGRLLWTSQESTYSQSSRVLIHDFARDETRTLFWSLEGARAIDVLAADGILFGTSSQRQNLRRITLGSPGSNEDQRWLTRGSGIDRQPVYSSDGEWILFSSTRSGNLDLWQSSPKSGAVKRLTDDKANDWDPAYSPDGQSILWSTDRSGHYEIWMASRDGSGARQVSNDGFDAENPTMTPDGKWIVYSSANPKIRGIWKMHPDGSGTKLLAGGTNILPEISPDGRWVSYVESNSSNAGRATIHVVAIDGTDASFRIEIESSVPGANLGRHRWLPDASGIAFWSADESGTFGIFAQDFAPGRDTSSTRRKLGGFDSDVQAESFGIAPNGSEMIVSVTDTEFAIALAEGVIEK